MLLNNEHAALKDAEHVTSIANAVLEARGHDPTRTAIGLAVIAQLIAEQDQSAKTALAFTFAKMVRELDPHVLPMLEAKWN